MIPEQGKILRLDPAEFIDGTGDVTDDRSKHTSISFLLSSL